MTNNSEKPNGSANIKMDYTQGTSTPLIAYVWLSLCVLLLCYPLAPEVILTMKNTGGFLEGFVLYFAPITLFPFFVFKTTQAFYPRKKIRFWLPILALFAFPVFIMFSNNYVIKTELKSNGVNAKAKLSLNEEIMKSKLRTTSRKKEESRLEYEERQRRQREQAEMRKPYNCSYKVNGEVFVTVVYPFDSDTSRLLKTDSIPIIYSKKHPQLFIYGAEVEEFTTNN